MLSWLRRFPHDVVHRKQQQQQQHGPGSGGAGARRTSSSTTWRNKSYSFTARIMRCASSVTHHHHDRDDGIEEEEEDDDDEDCLPSTSSSPPRPQPHHHSASEEHHSVVSAQAFSFRELAAAAGDFRRDKLIGEGGFGRVYRGRLKVKDKDEEEQAVAVKQLDRNGRQGNREFVAEVLLLSLLHHPNLVRLVGYCADGDQRLLVYEYMPLGSLEDHLLLSSGDDRLSWRRRMKIAHGAARGLEYLHERAVIFRDLKSSNILLDADYSPRLSDFGLARLLPPPPPSSSSSSSSSSGNSGGGSNNSRVMGTYGYCAPEYLRTGLLSAKSDVYTFGVLLLELITGRRAIDTSRPDGEQSLVGWAAPLFADSARLHELVDPRLVMAMRGPPAMELKQAVGVAAMCLQEHPAVRPVMADVVVSLSFLATATRDDEDP